MSLSVRSAVIIAALLLVSCAACRASDWDVKSDTWVATDALGRSLPGYAECGPPRPNKVVGIFYFTWLGQHGTNGPYDITKMLAANPTNPQYGPLYTFHHWGESELGYYLSQDAYVIRRHCEQLVDAGVDILMLDVTNGWSYKSVYMTILSVYSQIRSEGGHTPQVCFLVNPENNTLVTELYQDLYGPDLYSDIWFRWKGKPLMLTKPDGLSSTIQNFFTFRKCWAWSHGGGVPSWWWEDGHDKWTWLDNYPQVAGWHDQGVAEETSVTVAQHATSNIGRSFRNGSQPSYDQYKLCPTTGQGLCLAEQWQGALSIDPEFIFITGWNEWVAMRFTSDGTSTFLGETLPVGATLFVDEYNQEFSRDIEPMKGGHTDNYYYQMIDGIRRYKGVRKPEQPSAPKTIAVDGSFADWDDVGPEFRDTIGDAAHRNSTGWGTAGTYVNNTGRNDLVKSKATYDESYVYFYAETKDPISSYTGPNWMLLYIDADFHHSTGWNGYDYVINSQVIDATTTTLKRNTGGWNWTQVSNIPYRVQGNKLELRIPRSDIGFASHISVFDFHWADGAQQNGDIAEFFTNGDSAPDRRFNYRFDLPAEVTDVTSTNADGVYKIGVPVNIQVSFTKPVTVTGGPRLQLQPGSITRYASYASGSGTNTITFMYSVQTGDSSPDLDYTTASAVQLNGGSIKDLSTNDAILTLPAPGSPGSLGANKNLVIDGVRPAVVGVTSDKPNGAHKAGENIDISVAFTEPMVPTGTPLLELETGAVDRKASYISGSGTSALVFRYTVQPGDASSDLAYKATNSLTGTMRDVAGNTGSITLPALGSANSLSYSKALVIDTAAPSTVAAPASGVYGSAREVTLTASEASDVYYTVDGSEPTAGSPCYTVPISVSSDTVLRFYAVDTAGNEESPKKQETYKILSTDGSIAAAKVSDDGSLVRLANKALYLKRAGFGYIEEPSRASGVRIEGSILANQGDLVCLTGTLHKPIGGEPFVALDMLTLAGPGPVRPVGMPHRTLETSLPCGLYVRAWGTVVPGSITSNSYVITDGSDSSGIKVITPSAPTVLANQFVTVTGAAGFDQGRVIYMCD